MKKKIDLKQFCSTDEYRLVINSPVRVGGFVYFTDGRIILRVLLADWRKIKECEDERLRFGILNKLEFEKLDQVTESDAVEIPEIKSEFFPCEECKGTGSCNGTSHDCDECDGTGKIEQWKRIKIKQFYLNSHYLRRLKEIGATLYIRSEWKNLSVVAFKFPGGDGLLMPMKGDVK